jgi:hypothetical protein
MHRRLFSAALLVAVAALAVASSSALAQSLSFQAATPAVASVTGTSANQAPWTLSQGDPSESPWSSSLPT